jgi:hypothetical protein
VSGLAVFSPSGPCGAWPLLPGRKSHSPSPIHSTHVSPFPKQCITADCPFLQSCHAVTSRCRPSLFKFNMLKFWQSGPSDQTTPKASANPERNPFDTIPSTSRSTPPPSRNSSFILASGALTPRPGSGGGDGPASAGVARALPTTGLSKAEPQFNFTTQPLSALGARRGGRDTPGTPGSAPAFVDSPPPRSSSTTPGQRGRLHARIVEARSLAVDDLASPYVVATFDQNEFVSRGYKPPDKAESASRKKKGLRRGGESARDPAWQEEVVL